MIFFRGVVDFKTNLYVNSNVKNEGTRVEEYFGVNRSLDDFESYNIFFSSIQLNQTKQNHHNHV